MDDTLGFDENAKKESSASEWQMGIHSALSMDNTSNRPPFQENLYVVPQKEILTNRRKISATLLETLSFYCCYTSTLSKIEILCMQQNNVNRFFWFYILNVICKSLPMTYVYIFLSIYAPDYHFFHPKMFPLCYGINLINVVTALFNVCMLVENTALYFSYVFSGLMYKTPWNRCVSDITEVNGYDYNCYNLSEFSKKFRVDNITHQKYFYSTSSNENFSLAQLEYFDNVLNEADSSYLHNMNIITLMLWIGAALLYKQIFKRYVWKILHYTHIALCGMFLMIFIHLALTYENADFQKIQTADEDQKKYLMNADFDLIAESMTAPPIVHIISARSKQEIKPNRNSAIIVTCNAIYYIFRASTSYLMKRYCENWIKGTIIHWNFGSYSHFYFWPIYFATLYFGDFLVLIFFALHGIADSCTFIIMFSCILESIVCEWSWMKPWRSILLMTMLYLIINHINSNGLIDNCFVCWTAVSTLAETIIIFWLYPLGRLVDDITFHYGITPTKLRVWSFIVLPIYYLIKASIIIHRLMELEESESTSNTRYSFVWQAFFLSLGAAYAFYYYVIKKKKSWIQLIKPAPEWGPKDLAAKQLRKQFDSRNYIGSQAPRILSRHLINKSDLKSYKLDIPYESVTRRATVQDEKET
ncbi:unnamed protein product [Euphydryas editha]|uniref:Uncharacterized protein n=1 Tax=Euphydryas editha TaxID=104508 RepID=A0AAU9UNV1_EUPED|nr:unnamed protein product [Euphydryas editha]